jgi:hypothetical protein
MTVASLPSRPAFAHLAPIPCLARHGPGRPFSYFLVEVAIFHHSHISNSESNRSYATQYQMAIRNLAENIFATARKSLGKMQRVCGHLIQRQGGGHLVKRSLSQPNLNGPPASAVWFPLWDPRAGLYGHLIQRQRAGHLVKKRGPTLRRKVMDRCRAL